MYRVECKILINLLIALALTLMLTSGYSDGRAEVAHSDECVGTVAQSPA